MDNDEFSKHESEPSRPPLDHKKLEAAALEYLGRYATSSVNLGRVLRRRIERHRIRHRVETPDGDALVARIVLDCVQHGYVDDQRYARDRAAVLWRAGRSKRYIEGYLGSKGISRDSASEAVQHAHQESGGSDFEAALTYAKKRKFGPFRKDISKPMSRDQSERQLAALARQGFSYAIARKIISADQLDDLNDS